jgi:hypothetical protein
MQTLSNGIGRPPKNGNASALDAVLAQVDRQCGVARFVVLGG